MCGTNIKGEVCLTGGACTLLSAPLGGHIAFTAHEHEALRMVRMATLAPKASTSRASGGGCSATFATFHGLGEGVGALPLPRGGGPPQRPPPQAPASYAWWAFPPWAHTTRPMRRLQFTHRWGGLIPPNLLHVPPTPLVQVLPHFPPSVLPRCLINEAHPQQKVTFSFGGGHSSQTNTKKPQPFPPQRHSAIWPFPPEPTHRRGG